jgi:hypothetical protein
VRLSNCMERYWDNASQEIVDVEVNVGGCVVERSKLDVGKKVNLVSAFSLPALPSANSLLLESCGRKFTVGKAVKFTAPALDSPDMPMRR